MKNERLLKIIGEIDDRHIQEDAAIEKKVYRTDWTKWGALAACFCLAVAGSIIAFRTEGNDTMTGDPIQPAGSLNTWSKEQASAGVEQYGLGDYSGALERPKADINTGYESEEETMRFMIGHYDDSLNGTDMAVNNGHYELSGSLSAAIEELGDTVRYRVVIEVFKDGTVIDSGSAEVASEEERLVKEKYTVAHETYEDSMETEDYFTIHAEKDQLLNFPVSSLYGYYISLYDEYLGLASPMDDVGVVFSIPSITMDAPVDESDENFMDAAEYPAEILEVQQAISNGMACGDLPFVYESAICEDPLRIEVFVDTEDEALIAKVKEYDPSGQYIVVRQDESGFEE